MFFAESGALVLPLMGRLSFPRMSGIKAKMHGQIQPSIAPLRSAQVQQEIRNFLRALDSYPARVAKEPRVSFHQHLCSVFAAAPDHRRDTRSQRQHSA
jgi:hypothetical protein